MNLVLIQKRNLHSNGVITYVTGDHLLIYLELDYNVTNVDVANVNVQIKGKNPVRRKLEMILFTNLYLCFLTTTRYKKKLQRKQHKLLYILYY